MLMQFDDARLMTNYPSQEQLHLHLQKHLQKCLPTNFERILRQQLGHVPPITSAHQPLTVEQQQRKHLLHELHADVVRALQHVMPTMHWSTFSGWVLAEAMGEVVHARTKQALHGAFFFSISLDEASKHGRSYLCIHAYVMEDSWDRVPLFLKVCGEK
jgi:hypothetical protein